MLMITQTNNIINTIPTITFNFSFLFQNKVEQLKKNEKRKIKNKSTKQKNPPQ